jgi:hypothetical protein
LFEVGCLFFIVIKGMIFLNKGQQVMVPVYPGQLVVQFFKLETVAFVLFKTVCRWG